MIYMHITVSVVSGKMEEFHDFWSKKSLPLWEKYGAKHVGSWSTVIGKGHEIVRLFAFEDLAHYEKFQQFLWQDEDGQRLRFELDRYIADYDIKFLMPAEYSPLK